VDGRIWFYSNVRNYWTDAGSASATDWFGLDFGGDKKFRSLRLYFYADGARFKAPMAYTVQFWNGRGWTNVAGAHEMPAVPLANGENTVTFTPVQTSRLRLRFTNPKPAAVALVEVKAYASDVAAE